MIVEMKDVPLKVLEQEDFLRMVCSKRDFPFNFGDIL